jgi:hypothetical protein
MRSRKSSWILYDKGVIRYKDLPDKKLDDAVDDVLGKLERKRKNGPR